MSSERQLLDKNDPWWGEHVHRYDVVLPLLNGKEVILDLACGTGFGTDILAQYTTGKVVGGDIAADAIDECKSNWKRSNIEFRVLDGTQLAFSDKTFDVIVSFETIEHTTQYLDMLREFQRVLKDSGVAIISTPNFPINSPSGKVTNPYHTQEFKYDELCEILNSVFKEVSILGQEFIRFKGSGTHWAGKWIDFIFNVRGIRKFTPYWFKTGVSKLITGKPFYPDTSDFNMTDIPEDVIKCKTFYCLCRK